MSPSRTFLRSSRTCRSGRSPQRISSAMPIASSTARPPSHQTTELRKAADVARPSGRCRRRRAARRCGPGASVTSCSSARSSRPPLASMVKVREGLSSVGKSSTGRMSKASDGDQSMTRPVAGSRVCQYQPESGREKLPPLRPSTAPSSTSPFDVGRGDQRQEQRFEPRVEIALDRTRELHDEHGAGDEQRKRAPPGGDQRDAKRKGPSPHAPSEPRRPTVGPIR